MKKLCSIFLAFAISFLSLNIPQYSNTTAKAKNEVSVWDGSVDTSWYDSHNDVMYISTAEQLAGLSLLSNNSKEYFKDKIIYLTSDIDLDGKPWTPIYLFSGTFDGQYHKIKGLSFKATAKDDCAYGLFSHISGVAKNTEILDCNINLTGNSSKKIYIRYIGALCAYLTPKGEIHNCKSSGKISVTDSSEDSRIGGICGVQYENTIIDGCANNCSIINNHKDTGKAISGGISGLSLNDSQILNSYNTGSINSIGGKDITNHSSRYVAYAGGIVGRAGEKQTIKNCYNVGSINSEAGNTSGESTLSNGSIIGHVYAEITTENNYYLTATADKGIGVVTREDNTISVSATDMKKESFALALGNAFSYKEDSYPVLKWELPSERDEFIWDNPHSGQSAFTRIFNPFIL